MRTTKKEHPTAGKSARKTKEKNLEPQQLEEKQLKRFDELERFCVSAVTLGKLTELTPNSIQLKAKEGKLTRNQDRTFDLVPNLVAIVKELRQTSSKGGRPAETSGEAEYWRAAKLREQSMEGRRQIAEEIIEAILRGWRGIAEAWLQRCRPEAREDVRQLFADFERVAATITIEDAGADDGSDDAEEVDNG